MTAKEDSAMEAWRVMASLADSELARRHVSSQPDSPQGSDAASSDANSTQCEDDEDAEGLDAGPPDANSSKSGDDACWDAGRWATGVDEVPNEGESNLAPGLGIVDRDELRDRVQHARIVSATGESSAIPNEFLGRVQPARIMSATAREQPSPDDNNEGQTLVDALPTPALLGQPVPASS